MTPRGGVNLVYHLAALVMSGEHKYDDIPKLIESNILMGTKLLEAMKENSIHNFINAGTFAQHYEDAEYNPVDLYGATKQGFEDIIKYYVNFENMKVIKLHIFNTYGSNDKKRRMMALLKETADSGETLKMSPGEQLIDTVYIDDIIDAFMLAGDYLVKGQYDLCGTYGLSSGNPIILRDVIKTFEKVSGKKLNIEWGGRPYREREIMVPWTSYKTLPGWQPKISLEEGIKRFLSD